MKLRGAGTFSILARSPESGLLGAAVASGSISVGGRVLHAKPGVGVVVTQAYTNPMYGAKGLEMLGQGRSPRAALDELLKRDRGKEFRQVAIMDFEGGKAVFTGKRVTYRYGEAIGEDFIVMGNLLRSKAVIDSMMKGFEGSTGGLAWRMVHALEAGSQRGGDRRGERSAALLVLDAEDVKVIRVDEARAPIRELGRKLNEIFKEPKA